MLKPPDEKQELIKHITLKVEGEDNKCPTTEFFSKQSGVHSSDARYSSSKEEEGIKGSDKLESRANIPNPSLDYFVKNHLKIDNSNYNCDSSQQLSGKMVFNEENATHFTKVLFNNNVDLVNGKSIPNENANHSTGLSRRLSLPVSHNQQVRKLPTSYLKDLRVHRHSLTYRGAMLNINRYRLRASSCPDIYRNSMTTIAKEKDEVCSVFFVILIAKSFSYSDFYISVFHYSLQWYAGLWGLWYVLADMFDFSHFSDLRFSLFAFSNFLLYTW